MRRGIALALTGFALLAATVQDASAQCIERHRVPIATGLDPHGETWSLEGSIGNNGGCREWLIGMDFSLPGAGNWGWGTGIPAGGHLSWRFHVDASDYLLEDGSYRVFSGSVSGETAKIVVRLSSGKGLVIRPRSVLAALRSRIDWLRNVRYFVEYYPPTGFVTSVSLLDASGQLLYRTSGDEDGFF